LLLVERNLIIKQDVCRCVFKIPLMKKIIFLIVIVVTCSRAKAQIAKGTMMLGSSFSIYSQNQRDINTDTNRNTNTYDNKSTNINIDLRYGYFVNDHVMLGIFAGYGINQTRGKQVYDNYNNPSNNSNQNNASNNHTISGGIFARYYKMLGSSRFGIYGQVSCSYGGGKTKSNSAFTGPLAQVSNETHGDHTQFSTYINPGIVYFINNRFAIETSFGSAGYYARRTKTYNGNIKTEGTSGAFNASLALQSLNFGFNFYFGGNAANKETKG
jgi:hypothetical protein